VEWSSLKKSQESMNIYEWDAWCFGYGTGTFDYYGVVRDVWVWGLITYNMLIWFLSQERFWPIVQFVLWLNEVS
jgi:hypothetical protein